jgi:hypothetical protein
MTKIQQVNFVLDLCHAVRKDVVAQIDDGKIPEEWDGHELRRLLADRFEDAAQMSRPMADKRGKRYRDYANVKLINNL